jgi:hypothetical protein
MFTYLLCLCALGEADPNYTPQQNDYVIRLRAAWQIPGTHVKSREENKKLGEKFVVRISMQETARFKEEGIELPGDSWIDRDITVYAVPMHGETYWVTEHEFEKFNWLAQGQRLGTKRDDMIGTSVFLTASFVMLLSLWQFQLWPKKEPPSCKLHGQYERAAFRSLVTALIMMVSTLAYTHMTGMRYVAPGWSIGIMGASALLVSSFAYIAMARMTKMRRNNPSLFDQMPSAI